MGSITEFLKLYNTKWQLLLSGCSLQKLAQTLMFSLRFWGVFMWQQKLLWMQIYLIVADVRFDFCHALLMFMYFSYFWMLWCVSTVLYNVLTQNICNIFWIYSNEQWMNTFQHLLKNRNIVLHFQVC